MSMQSLIERISQLTQTVEQSAANHNALVGRLAEAKSLFDMLSSFKLPGNVGKIIGGIDAAVDTADSIVNPASNKEISPDN